MLSARRLLASVLLGGGALVSTGLPAVAATATATVKGGTLGFVSAPANTGFNVSLTGNDAVTTATQTFDVGDATGSGSGWNITATSTTFTAGSRSLSPTSVTVPAVPTVACDSGASCTVATNGVNYPYTLPAGATAPTATKIFNAAANTGLGNQTVTLVLTLAVPANTFAGNYSSTWTYTLVSGP
jgi:putative surface cell wall-binding protein